MGASAFGPHRAAFGQRSLQRDELSALAESGVPFDAGDPPSLESASLRLLESLASRDSAELLFQWCRLNRDDVAQEIENLRSSFALPLCTASAVAEVLAQALAEMRVQDASGRQLTYRRLPSRCRQTLRTFVDECLGFVPAPDCGVDALAVGIADWIELPDDLSAAARARFAGPTALVIAAQVLLEESRLDRRLLLEPPADATQPCRHGSIAELLSRRAAFDRFEGALDQAAAWIRACRAPSHRLTERSPS